MDKESLKEQDNDKKPSKKEKSTLGDYLKEVCEKSGIKIEKRELPKGWTKVIFKK